MLLIDCTIESENWGNADDLQALSQVSLDAILMRCGEQLPKHAEVSILFTDNDAVQTLNKQWRDQDKPTNVLSFASNEGGGPVTPLLGDIVLAHETIVREAGEQDKDFTHHLQHLIIHGFLHLLGYDHIEDDDAEVMEKLETETLADLGIADPYQTS